MEDIFSHEQYYVALSGESEFPPGISVFNKIITNIVYREVYLNTANNATKTVNNVTKKTKYTIIFPNWVRQSALLFLYNPPPHPPLLI